MVQEVVSHSVVGQHSDSVKFGCFSPSGRLVAAADADRNVCVWRTEPTGNVLENMVWNQSLRHSSDRFRAMDHVRSMVFADEETLLIASGETLRAMDIRNCIEVWRREAAPEHGFLVVTPVSLARSQTGRIACAYADGLLEMYEPGMTEPVWTVLDNDGPVRVQFTADGNRVVGTDRFSVCAYDTVTGHKVARFCPPEKSFGLAASRVSDQLIVRSLFHCRTYEGIAGGVTVEIPTRAGFPNVECHPTRTEYASVDAWGFSVLGFDGSVKTRVDTEYRPIGIAFSEQGRLLVTSLDGALRIYEV